MTFFRRSSGGILAPVSASDTKERVDAALISADAVLTCSCCIFLQIFYPCYTNIAQMFTHTNYIFECSINKQKYATECALILDKLNGPKFKKCPVYPAR